MKEEHKKEIKEKYPEGLKKQVLHDYCLLFEENEFMNRRNALRTIQREWNMPIELIKSIIDERRLKYDFKST